MKVLLLGASGRTGALVLDVLISSGYHVNCLTRRPHKVGSSPRITLIVGDPRRTAHLSQALHGCQAVISVLNVSRKSDFPWSKLKTPPTFMSDVMKSLIPLMNSNGVKRIVVCSAWGVAETKDHIPGWLRWLIDHSNIGAAYQDHDRQEQLIKSSGLDWTIVRPAALLNGRRVQSVRESYDNTPRPSPTINRITVASYLVNGLKRTDLVRKATVVSS